MHKLYRSTPLEDSFACNFNLLIEGRPMVLGVRSILQEWLKFRVGCIRNRIAYDIKDLGERLHLLKGLERVILDIDKAIRVIRETEEDRLVVPNLMEGFAIDQMQAEYVADIRLRNINREYLLRRISEVEELERALMHLQDLMGSERKIHQLIKKELAAVAKTYGKPRRTEIVSGEDRNPGGGLQSPAFLHRPQLYQEGVPGVPAGQHHPQDQGKRLHLAGVRCHQPVGPAALLQPLQRV